MPKRRSAATAADSSPHISTGFPALDGTLGIGGLPRGRLCELVGPVTSGKTTLALKFLAQAQADGGQVAYVDQTLYAGAGAQAHHRHRGQPVRRSP